MRKKVRNSKAGAHEARRVRIAGRVSHSTRPRLTVYRSAKHMYAQLVDPAGRTLGQVSTRSKELGGAGATGNVDAAKRVGKAVAELARRLQIEEVVFHRNGFLYHGRVKALAEAAREAGLRF
jgi:large subunit ribosomal protein L18